MPEKDAFGRDVGEDPLAAMGWSDDGTGVTATPTETTSGDPLDHAPPVPPARPAQAARPRQPPQAPSWPPPTNRPPAQDLPPHMPQVMQTLAQLREASAAPSPRRRRGGGGRVVLVLFTLVVIVGGMVALAVKPVVDTFDAIDDFFDDPVLIAPRDGGTTATPAPDPPVGLQRQSLLQRQNFASALARLRARAGGRVRTLRLAPDRIDVQVVTSTSRLRSLQARWTGEVAVLSDVSAPGVTAAPSFPWSAIDAAAPRRIVRKALGGRSSREVRYLVLTEAAGLRWSLHLTTADLFIATANGRSVRAVGGG